MTRHTVKVTYSTGDAVTTEINGTKEAVLEYFSIGRRFNIGSSKDLIATVIKAEIL